MRHKILALFCSIIISIPGLAAPITDKEVIDSVNNFFDALNVKNYGNGQLEESVTDDFLIFELADSYTLDEFKNFIESAGFLNWQSTQWTLSDFTISVDENSAHVSYLNTGVFIYKDPENEGQMLREDTKWLESVYLKVDKGKLKLKFLQSDDIERVVSPVVN